MDVLPPVRYEGTCHGLRLCLQLVSRGVKAAHAGSWSILTRSQTVRRQAPKDPMYLNSSRQYWEPRAKVAGPKLTNVAVKVHDRNIPPLLSR